MLLWDVSISLSVKIKKGQVNVCDITVSIESTQPWWCALFVNGLCWNKWWSRYLFWSFFCTWIVKDEGKKRMFEYIERLYCFTYLLIDMILGKTYLGRKVFYFKLWTYLNYTLVFYRVYRGVLTSVRNVAEYMYIRYSYIAHVISLLLIYVLHSTK